MADSYKLTDGTNEYELIYNSSSQSAYRLRYGGSMSPGEPVATWHQPDYYPAELISVYDPNRTAYFTVDFVDSTDIDTNLNNLTKLRRWVDGASQQAARYWSHGDVKRIDLKVQRTGATNATLHPVKVGFIDDGGAQHSAPSGQNAIAWDVTLALTLAPYGEADAAISLKNYVKTPAMLIADGNGLAENHVAMSAAAGEYDIDTTAFLVGGASQHFNVGSISEGSYTDVITSDATTVVAYVWVYPVSGAVRIRLENVTVPKNTDLTLLPADSTSVSDKSAIDSAGNTWYRCAISDSSFTSGNTFRLRTFSSAGASEWYTDAEYMQFGTTTAPNAWCSYYSIENRGDTTTANPEQINYIDIWDVPGDAPALVKYVMDNNTGGVIYDRLIVGRRQEGVVSSGTNRTLAGHWIDSAEWDESGGAWTEPAQMHYDTVAGGASDYIQEAWKANDSSQYRSLPVRVYAIAETNDIATAQTLQLRWIEGSAAVGTEISNPTANFSSLSNDVEGIIDLGTMVFSGTQDFTTAGTDTSVLRIYATTSAAGKTIDVYAIILMPTEEFLITGGVGADWQDTRDQWIDGTQKLVSRSHSALGVVQPHLGTMWYVSPGKWSRTIFLLYYSSSKNSILIDQVMEFSSVQITPRTRHLLGTI